MYGQGHDSYFGNGGPLGGCLPSRRRGGGGGRHVHGGDESKYSYFY